MISVSPSLIRLQVLGDGKGPLMLSGGRMRNNHSNEPLVWSTWSLPAGGQRPSGATWEEHSISYWHNKLGESATRDVLK
jgi:hypothetical protein